MVKLTLFSFLFDTSLENSHNFNTIHVFCYCHIGLVVVCSTEAINCHVSSESLPFDFHDLNVVLDLLTLLNIFIVVSDHGMENCPHYLREVNMALMVSYIQAVDDFVKSLLADFHSFKTEW